MRPFLAALALFLATGPTAMAATDDMPPHEVLATAQVDGTAVELRRYAPVIVAEVTVEAPSRDAASSMGFRPLADYIFGNNRPQARIAMTAPVTTVPATDGERGQRIAMTAPVTTAADGAGAYVVRFRMPPEWTMDTLPEPLDPAVRLVELPARDMAVVRFTGPRDRDAVAAAQTILDAYVAGTALSPAGPFVVTGYDGPRVPSARRRWEVQRPVAGAPSP
ncbi:heme-binding protein [Jannaschia sp. LMIT008]|uniref:SOUL family heme-binding protein n=1 Tax=Jannaschia maritima TaxID=3032585 RepID=UPI0028121628|nr:heme-binding protein [Jannaschia sp. LMIT008]